MTQSIFSAGNISIVNTAQKLLNAMGKTSKLPERPKPPDKEHILEDLKKASDEDIIFSDLKTQTCKF